MNPAWRSWLAGEFFGTFLLVFFRLRLRGGGGPHRRAVGIFQVAIVWGLGIATAIYLTGAMSGAHLNPAVTCALATSGRCPPGRVAIYVRRAVHRRFCRSRGAAGRFRRAARSIRAGPWDRAGRARQRGDRDDLREFFPNPAGHPLTDVLRATVTPGTAFMVEAIGTALLVLVILGVTDERNPARPRELTAVTIGLTITMLIPCWRR